MSSDTYEPTPEDIQWYQERADLAHMNPHQRDTYARLAKRQEQEEAWAEENRDWLGEHPELWDGED